MTHESSTPEERFAGDMASVDLDALAEEMMARATGSEHGRAQRTMYKHGPTTIAMFAFRRGAGLPEHSADGTVSIQAIAGEVVLTAEDRTVALKKGHLLRFAPGVKHSVLAETDAAILVHIARAPSSV